MQEPAIDAKAITTTKKLEVYKKVLKKYRMEGDTSNARAYARAIADAVCDVELTEEDYDEIKAMVKANREKRMVNRQRRAHLNTSK